MQYSTELVNNYKEYQKRKYNRVVTSTLAHTELASLSRLLFSDYAVRQFSNTKTHKTSGATSVAR